MLGTILTLGAAAQAPPAAPSTSMLSGRVIDDVRRQGIQSAQITISDGDLRIVRSTTSNSQGDFSFSDVAPGPYHAIVESPGYFREGFVNIDVPAGAPVALGDIVLTAQRTISGVLRWSNGEPAVHAQVRVLAVKRGKLTMYGVAGGTGTAGDQGEFKLRGLQPGHYILHAIYPAAPARDPVERVAQPQFYPGYDTPDAGRTIDLVGSADLTGVSLILQEQPGVNVEGTVIPSEALPEGSRATVSLTVLGVPTDYLADDATQAGKDFQIPHVPPGDYLLTLTSTSDAGTGMAASRFMATINVGAFPVTGLRISFPEVTPIAGKIELQDGGKVTPVAGISVSRDSDRVGRRSLGPSPATDQNGEFRLADALPGDLMFQSAPKDAYIARLTQGVRDLSGGPFSVAGGDPIHILLKKDGGRIEGRVKNGDAPAGQAFVVLAPRNRSAVNWFRTATTGLDGSFKFTSIVPGDYDLFAFDRNEDDSYFDQVYLQKFTSQASAVSVAPGSSGSARLDLLKTGP